MNRERSKKNEIRDKKKLIYSHIRFTRIFSPWMTNVCAVQRSQKSMYCVAYSMSIVLDKIRSKQILMPFLGIN